MVVRPRRSTQHMPNSRHSARQRGVPLLGRKGQDVTQGMDGSVPVTHAQVSSRQVDLYAVYL